MPGLLAILGAALLIVVLFLPFRSDTVWAEWDREIPWAMLPFGVFGLVAGALIIRPPTARLIGPGLLLGIAPMSACWLVFLAAGWSATREYGINRGFWLAIAGHLAVVVAAWLTAIALKRAGAVRLAARAPDDAVIWSVLLLGIVGSLAALVSILQSGDPLIATIWVPILAAAMPLCAAAAVPRIFGSWVLTGWSLGGLTLYAYILAGLGTPSGDAPLVALGVTLVALLPAAWFLARTRSRTDVNGTGATHA